MRVQFSRLFPSLSVLGLLFAVIAMHQSMAPTLLVRTWFFQGLVTGVAITLGYAFGTILQRLGGAVIGYGVRWYERRSDSEVPRPSERTQWRLRLGFLVLLAVLTVLAIVDTVRLQRWTWDRLNHAPDLGLRLLLGTALVAAVVAAVLVGFFLLIRWMSRRVTWLAGRVLPKWIAAGLATVLVLYAVAFALNNWVYQRTLDGLNQAFTLADSEIEEEYPRPTSDLLSGGPASEVKWEDMGVQGRRFMARGPSVEELTALDPNGNQAIEPVRAFVGRANAEDVDERIDLAMKELEGFKAFERELVLVVVPTGTGWINEQIVQPLEYTFGGNIATIAVQYSHLPSPLAFLTEAQAAQASAELLIRSLEERITAIPEDERPLFVVAGESLGTFGASGAFDDLDDLLASTDASLWNGPPASVHLRRQAERERAEGSLQIKPDWTGSDRVLFANRASEIVADDHPNGVDAVFLQQADDAIVWWEWPVLWDEPEWLEEPLDPAVNPRMRWFPVSTMLNLAVDMAVATAFDHEQGHKYGTQPALAWRLMLERDGWDDAAYDRLLDTLRQIPADD